MTTGDRVQAHPATDAWMSGDRYGTVLRINGAGNVVVRMDWSGRTRTFSPGDVIAA